MQPYAILYIDNSIHLHLNILDQVLKHILENVSAFLFRRSVDPNL